MTPEQKERALAWAQALRSGNYKPFAGALKREHQDVYCCLGVLCNEYDSAGWGQLYSPHDLVLNRTIQEWVGLRTVEGEFKRSGLSAALRDRAMATGYFNDPRYLTDYGQLAGLNDCMTRQLINPFPLIADIIEFGITHPKLRLFVGK